MKLRKVSYQAGQLSLLGAAVLVAVFTLVMMGLLFSWRYERNFFADGWVRLMATLQGAEVQKAVQKTKSVVVSTESGKGSSAIRRCTIDGSIVYSNVDCGADNTGSRKVDLYDTRGFEPPQKPVTTQSEKETPASLKEKMIEQVIAR